MATIPNGAFDPKAFLANVGEGRSITKSREGEVIFSQGDPADALFYIQRGKVKVTTLSSHGKEAVVAILGAGDLSGRAAAAHLYRGRHGRLLDRASAKGGGDPRPPRGARLLGTLHGISTRA